MRTIYLSLIMLVVALMPAKAQLLSISGGFDFGLNITIPEDFSLRLSSEHSASLPLSSSGILMVIEDAFTSDYVDNLGSGGSQISSSILLLQNPGENQLLSTFNSLSWGFSEQDVTARDLVISIGSFFVGGGGGEPTFSDGDVITVQAQSFSSNNSFGLPPDNITRKSRIYLANPSGQRMSEFVVPEPTAATLLISLGSLVALRRRSR